MALSLDERYMRMALRLARKGTGRTSPNPMVGAVVVREGSVVGRGYHSYAGGDHAEIVALERAGRAARGSTLYLNLEPCSHYGRTPPCTESLVRAGVKRVVVGMIDPNPLVSGRGIERLRRAGILTAVGACEQQCRELNEAFVKYINEKKPFVILKLAVSLDGKIATVSGDSKWITGTASREYVHRLRNECDAILIGSGTVLADDPMLTCRIKGGRDPWRVVLDRRLRTPVEANLLHQKQPEKTILVSAPGTSPRKRREFERLGAQVWCLPCRGDTIPLNGILRRLGAMGLLKVMIEGGATTASRALREKVVDKLFCFYAPKLIGGDGRTMIGPLGVRRMSESRPLRDTEIKKFANDILVTGYL